MNRSQVALKLMNGEWLNRAEFQVAKQFGMIEGSLMYEDYDGDYYKSPTLCGYICTKHPSLEASRTAEGECGWGLHALDHLQGRYLSENNKRLLVKLFGDDILERIPYSRVPANERTCEDCCQDPDECPNCLDLNGCATKYKSPDIEGPDDA